MHKRTPINSNSTVSFHILESINFLGLVHFHRSLGSLEALGSAPTLEKMALKWDLQSFNPASGEKWDKAALRGLLEGDGGQCTNIVFEHPHT